MKKVAFMAACVLIAGCSSPHEATTAAVNRPELATRGKLTVQTVAVGPNHAVQRDFTAPGGGAQPKITWSGVPPETKEIEVLIEDSDASGDVAYIHLLVEGIEPKQTEYPGPSGQVGQNAAGKEGYTPPDPPPGMPHHYHFEVIAVDTHPGLEPMPRDQLIQKLTSHVVATGEVVGTFGG